MNDNCPVEEDERALAGTNCSIIDSYVDYFATVSLAVDGLVLSEPVEVALPFALGSNVASLRESHRSASLPE